MDLLSVLRGGGVEVIEVPNWRTRERPGTFTPVGQMNHHTAGGGTSDHPSLDICINGRTGIPGPLCNGLISRSNKLHLISDGRANDSGMGRSDVRDLVMRDRPPNGRPTLADDLNGNPWFYDWEFENNGINEPFSPEMMEVAYKINVAVARWQGWTGNRSIAHFEWTKRKPDPRGWDMSAFRRGVQNRLTPVVTPPPPTTGDPDLAAIDNLPRIESNSPQAADPIYRHYVRTVQALMFVHQAWPSDRKYEVEVDGIFGAGTKWFLAAWQDAAGLKARGEQGFVGPLTWRHMYGLPY